VENKLDKPIVVKIGGSTFGRHEPTVLDIGDIEDIVALQKQGKSLVVVHGGGNLVTDWLVKQGTPTQFVHGERVTDRATLEMVTAVLAGLVNKEIVASINCLGGQAAGISGVDGALIQSKLRNEEMGYVGTVVKVNTALLEALIQAGFIPVVAPLSLHSFQRSDEAPRILNINGDPLAGEIAAAIGAERLIFLTDVAGVCNREGELLPRLSPEEAKALVTKGVASGGMIPKINACLTALSNTKMASIIGGKTSHALLKEIEEGGVGTTIQNNIAT